MMDLSRQSGCVISNRNYAHIPRPGNAWSTSQRWRWLKRCT
jgi:hypothetical protein